MSENHRLPDYLDHIQLGAADARSFAEGLSKDDLFADKRTQQAVIMSLIIIGEAATKVMDGYAGFTRAHTEVPRRSMHNMRTTAISTSTSMWCRRRPRNGCQRFSRNFLPCTRIPIK